MSTERPSPDKSARPPSRNADYRWAEFDSEAYFQHYYGDPHPDDDRVIRLAVTATKAAPPLGAELDVVDPELAASLGDGVRVIKQDRGVFDAIARQVLPEAARIAGMRKESPISMSSPRETITSRPAAWAASSSTSAAALLVTTVAASLPK